MLVRRDVEPFLVHEDASILTALRRISDNRSRAVFVISSDGRLLGSLSDGDFRRWVTSADTPSLDAPCALIAKRDCRSARHGAPTAAVEALFGSGVDLVPLLDEQRRIVAVASPRTADFEINGRHISTADPVFVIAEIGINHNGSLDTAKRLIDAAAGAGAECAKFQMRDMGALYRKSGAGLAGEDLGAQYTLDLLAEAALTPDEMREAMGFAEAAGLIALCTPWDLPSARILDSWNVPAFKVASADLTNHDLLSLIGGMGRPLIVSTGMSTEAEIIESVELLSALSSPFALLQCNSAYPSPFKDVQLRYMDRLAELGRCIVGYSGHERGHHVAIAAVARGAKIIEKHITLDRRGRGIDHVVSLEPNEFARMVVEIRQVEDSLGTSGPRTLTQGEQLNRLALAKSLVASRDLPAGTVVGEADIDVRSPGRGLQPNARSRLCGTVMRRPIEAGEFFFQTDLASVDVGPRDFHFGRPWGLPVRFHDWSALASASNPDFLEFHLSYRDLEVDIDQAIPDVLDLGLVVHSPDFFEGDHFLDMASDDADIRDRSIADLQRVIDLTRRLAPKFLRAGTPIVIANFGGPTLNGPADVSDRPAMYERVRRALALLDLEGVEIVGQTLPPFPWHLGGQRYYNLFVDAHDTASFAIETGIRLCLDASHTKLACNQARTSFSEAIERLAPLTGHLHLVDAAGVDGEGFQINEGEIDWPVLAKQLHDLAPGIGFIPEIWQGHVGGGQGFWTALDRLERILG